MVTIIHLPMPDQRLAAHRSLQAFFVCLASEANPTRAKRAFHKLLLNFTWWVNRKDWAPAIRPDGRRWWRCCYNNVIERVGKMFSPADVTVRGFSPCYLPEMLEAQRLI